MARRRESFVGKLCSGLEEIDGFEIFAAAEAVGTPLAFFARVSR